jgi:hypothetical protein
MNVSNAAHVGTRFFANRHAKSIRLGLRHDILNQLLALNPEATPEDIDMSKCRKLVRAIKRALPDESMLPTVLQDSMDDTHEVHFSDEDLNKLAFYIGQTLPECKDVTGQTLQQIRLGLASNQLSVRTLDVCKTAPGVQRHVFQDDPRR